MTKKKRDLSQGKFLHTLFENLHITKPRVITQFGKFLNSTLDSLEYNFFDFYKDYYKNTDFENFTQPYIICTGFGTLTYLENLTYDQKIIDYLNNRGLTIFFQEVLFISYDGIKNVQMCNFESMNDDELSYVRNAVYGTKQEGSCSVAEFESVTRFVVRNNLSKVHVKTFEGNTETLQPLYPRFTISEQNIWSDYVYPPSTNVEIYKNFLLKSNSVHKHFWCANRRYMPERHLLASYLYDKNGFLSFLSVNEKPNIETLKKHCWFDIDKLVYKNKFVYDTIISNLPIIEKQSPIFFPNENYRIDEQPEFFVLGDLMREAFVHILTESRYVSNFPIIGDRVRFSMVMCRPFIIVAPPYSLQYYRKNGYKTFSDFFDESYDTIENHEDRLLRIFELINNLISTPLQKLIRMLEDMESILKHNHNQVLMKWKNKCTE